jgi:hypothetical protein
MGTAVPEPSVGELLERIAGALEAAEKRLADLADGPRR